MRKSLTVASIRLVLGFCFIFMPFVFGNIPAVKAEDTQSLEGEWVPISSSSCWNNIKIVRQDGGYNVAIKYKPNAKCILSEGFHQGSPTQIFASRNIPSKHFADEFPAPVIRALAGKITYRYRFTLSGDGRSAELAIDKLGVSYYQNTGEMVDYQIAPFHEKTTMVRVASKTPENRGERAYQADCGVVDPNRITPFPPDHEFCPGNLVCMTNFCGGGMGCPYVCCPRGLPYLNHCDCKCYATRDFDCHSNSYCKEKPR